MFELTSVKGDLSNEINNNEMQNDVSKNKVSKRSFRGDSFEFGLVSGISL